MAAFRVMGFGAAVGLATAFSATAQEVVDLYGVNQATLEWSPASGPVTGYYVIVARDGGAPTLQGVSDSTRTTLESPFGGTLSVQVAAFDDAGVAGPVSPPSSTLRFNPAPSDGSSGDPTSPDPEPSEPPSDPGEPVDEAPDDGGGDPGEAPITTQTRFDFTGDGLSDLVLRDPQSGELALWAMQRAQVADHASLPHLPYPWSLEESGDYDGDGHADLLWRNTQTGQLIVWLARNGAVAGGAGLELPDLTRYWSIAGRGDFNGDGRDDIVLARPKRGVVDILHMDGTEVLARVSRRAPSNRWRVIATPDADGDGTAEIVWENLDSHALSLEWMSAPEDNVPLVSPAGDWRLLGTADWDGDGRDDLLMRNRSTRRVEAWLLDGDQVTRAGWNALPRDRYWAYRGLGDFDGDGRADSFWQHSTGSVEVWFAAEGGVERALLVDKTGGDKLLGDTGE